MPNNIHDTLFKATFSQVEHAAGVLRTVLPPAVVERIDFTTLKRCPGSFVDPELAERHTDLLFSVDFNGRTGFVYIVYEHQSTVDTLMAFRLLVYMVRIWEGYLKDRPEEKRIPVIVPVVLHHSTTGWTAPVTLEGLLDADPETLAAMGEQVVRFRFVLDDISHETDEEFKGRAMSALGRLVLWCLQTSRTPNERVIGINPCADLVRDVRRASSGAAALMFVWRYILSATHRYSLKAVAERMIKALGEETREEIMSVAEQLIEEGRQEGLEKRLDDHARSTLLKLLGLRFGAVPEATANQVKSAGTEKLDLWIERVLSAATLDDVLNDAGISTP